MQEFLVLGHIPGTNIEVTFLMWLYVVLVPLSALLLAKVFPSVRQSVYRQLSNLRARKVLQYLVQHNLL